MDDENVHCKFTTVTIQKKKKNFDSRRFLSLNLRLLRHSKKVKLAIMSNARPPNVPPTIRPIGTLDWVMALGVAVDESVPDTVEEAVRDVDESAPDTVEETVRDVDELAPDTVVEAVRDDGLDDVTDVDVAPAGMTRK